LLYNKTIISEKDVTNEKSWAIDNWQ
jgi:hypothetical protein